ncbi:unnamed protein product [Clonostachys chloroleuca]|uniref:Uncharacterized protein n=1 Tax=Clonostachys chloroleuca TaxID=1926264 RepID=A0AA35M1V1_9HYPO|nr:unnamed protein product [Clonostachys chloroleuca]
MSSRSGSYSRRPRPRQRESPLDRPSDRHRSHLNPVPLPGVHSFTHQGDTLTTSPLPTPQPRSSANAARRAERIRNIDEYSGFQRAPDQSGNHEQNLHTNSAHIDSLWATFDELEQASDLTNLQLRDLFDLTNTMSHTLPPGNASPLPRSFDPPDDNRRNKRRKIDADRLAPTISRIRYGKYGSVEPGALRMEILSCDGGSYASSNPSSYVAENILRNDETVYCTKGNRCNVVLRHEGGAPFTLHELVIKGPTSVNYSHPIREGMVFVAMRQDEVLTRTAQYQIQYSPLPQRDPLATTPEREDPPIRSIRYSRDGTTTGRFRRSQANGSEDEGYRMAQMPPEFSTNIPEFGVTTLCNDDDLDEHGRHITRRAPNRIGSLPFESRDSDEENNAASNNIATYNYSPSVLDFDDFLASEHQGNPSHLLRLAREQRERRERRETLRETPSSNQILYQLTRETQSQTQSRSQPSDTMAMSFAEALEAHNNATQEAVRAVGGELLAPHARFYIDKRSSTCSLTFDPPVSGRFILLKMWNSHHDPSSNIDIQTVMARGYAGGRYFPTVDFL